MTNATNPTDDRDWLDTRMYGTRYHDTADLSPAWLAEVLHDGLLDSQTNGVLPACRFIVAVTEGAATGAPHQTALRACVELHDIEPAELYPVWDTVEGNRTFLRRRVAWSLAPFGWTNPRHAFDRRFRIVVHLVGHDDPISACHLCGAPHPRPASAEGDR